jgi:hypothetical protein
MTNIHGVPNPESGKAAIVARFAGEVLDLVETNAP